MTRAFRNILRILALVFAASVFLLATLLSVIGLAKGHAACNQSDVYYKSQCNTFYGAFWWPVVFETLTLVGLGITLALNATRRFALPLLTFLAIATMGLIQLAHAALVLLAQGGDMPFDIRPLKAAGAGLVILPVANLVAICVLGYDRREREAEEGRSLLAAAAEDEDEYEEYLPLTEPGQGKQAAQGDYELPIFAARGGSV